MTLSGSNVIESRKVVKAINSKIIENTVNLTNHWVNVDVDKFRGEIVEEPTREDDFPIEEHDH